MGRRFPAYVLPWREARGPPGGGGPGWGQSPKLLMGSWSYVSKLLYEKRNHETCVNSEVDTGTFKSANSKAHQWMRGKHGHKLDGAAGGRKD